MAGATIDSLSIEIASSADKAVDSLSGLISCLETLRSKVSGISGLKEISSGIRSISKAMEGANIKSNASEHMQRFARSMQGFNGINGGNLVGLGAGLKALGEGARSVTGVSPKKLEETIVAVSGINSLGAISDMSGLPEAMQAIHDGVLSMSYLDNGSLEEFETTVGRLHESLEPLAEDLNTISEGIGDLARATEIAVPDVAQLTPTANNASDAIEETGREADKAATKIDKLSKSSLNIGSIVSNIRQFLSVGKDLFEKSADYEEAVNLARVAMGKGADEAIAYAKKVEELIGINQTEWITNVGTFNQMLQGFGIDSSAANRMSQQLTQLGYDIQSAFNVKDIDTVMARLQSGISGQIKGMRSYGVELSVAAMKEYMLSKGITASWTSLDQASKAALRYQKIMEATANMQGDLARTIVTPANALRILSSQCGIAARGLGQIVSVIATALIPYVQVAVNAIIALASAIASLFGYTLSDIDYEVGSAAGGISDSMDDVAGAIGGAGSAAEDAKESMDDLLASWDEINVIQSQSSSSGGSGGGGGGGGGGAGGIGNLLDGIGDYSYDFLDDIKDKVESITGVVENLKDYIVAALVALASYKLFEYIGKIYEVLKNIQNLSVWNKLSWLAAGITADFILTFSGVQDMLKNGFSKENILKVVIGWISGSIGGWIFTGSKMKGLAIGTSISLVATGLAFLSNAINDEENDAKAFFKTLIGSALAGVGTFGFLTTLGVGGATSAVISIPVAVALLVGGLIMRDVINNTNEIKASFESAFGDITLTNDEIDKLVKKLNESNFQTKIKVAYDDVTTAMTKTDEIKSSLSTIKKTDWLIRITSSMTEEQLATLVENVNSIVSDLNSINTSTGYMIKVTADIAFGSESNSVSEAVSGLVASNGAYIDELGKQASAKFNEAFSIGLNLAEGIDAYKEGMEIVAKMNEINNIVARAQSQTEFDFMTSSFELTDLDIKTAIGYENRLKEFAEQRKKDIEDELRQTLSSYKVQIEMGEWRLENVEMSSEERQKTEAQLAVMREQYQALLNRDENNVIYLQFKTDMDDMDRNLVEQTMTIFREALTNAINTSGDFSGFMRTMQEEGLDNGYFDSVLAVMKPDAEQSRKAIDEAREAGKIPAQAFIDSYRDYMTLLAANGDVNAYDYIKGSSLINAYEQFADMTELELQYRYSAMSDSMKQGFLDAFSGTDIWQTIQNAIPELKPQVEVEPVISEKEATVIEPTFDYAELEVAKDEATAVVSDIAEEIQTTEIKTNPVDTTETVQSVSEAETTVRGSVQAIAGLVGVVLPAMNAVDGSALVESIQSIAAAVRTSASQIAADMAFAGLAVPNFSRIGKAFSGVANVIKSKIPGFASGGFPEEGQLFIAREAGAEMVGSVGGHTAVANNDQIVSGIASGVAQANQSSDALMKQAISIMQQILAKRSTVEITPSAGLGKVMDRSAQMYSRVKG